MKALLRALAAGLLATLARGVLAKYRPTIVMVTGSVGKTSTKDAVAAALSERFHLRASEKSYNSEFGVPFTIIGAANPWESPVAWVKVVLDALALIFLPNHYPKFLVLEVGADRPGDLRRILDIATPDAVVVTYLPDVPVHVEAYASAQAVHEEEFTPAYALAHGAPLIINADDGTAQKLSARLSARVSTFGFSEGADVRLLDAEQFSEEGRIAGMRSAVQVNGKTYHLHARGALGRPQMYALAAAFASALALGLTPEEALKGLERYVPPSGRGRLLPGIASSTIIDDSYNASPAAAEEILHALGKADAPRKVAVLGDMLELGRYSAEEHARVGKRAAECAQVVVAVGPRAKALATAAEAESSGDVYDYPDATSAAEALPKLIKRGDLILIKGSQGIRMERIVKALLEKPEDARLLVRQEDNWLKR